MLEQILLLIVGDKKSNWKSYFFYLYYLICRNKILYYIHTYFYYFYYYTTMQKVSFFEKIGKIVFSFILTWLLVTWVVFAVNWDNLNDDDVVTWTHWQNLVSSIRWKINKSDFPTCAAWESLTYDWVSFSCNSPVASAAIESIQAWMVTNTSNSNKTINVTFATPFTSTPQIVVSAAWFYLNNSSRWETFDLNLSYSNVTKNGFKIVLPGGTPNNHRMRIKSASWIAIPASGSWNRPVVSNISSTCAPWQRTTNNEKNGSCIKWTYNNIYYWSEQTCTWFFGRPDREWFPTMENWYKYTKKYTQTCN